MLDTLLELKELFWGLNSDEYKEWESYFKSLSNVELMQEYVSHFIED